jgi:cytochrome c oxidase assembly protein subunit 15
MTRLYRLARQLALGGVVLMLLLACVSAYLRLSAAGIGCAPWPACYDHPAMGQQHHPVARLAHRLLASTLGLVVVMIALTSIAARPRRPDVVAPAFAALALTLMLAGLGSVTSSWDKVGISLANLLGGMALAALLWWLALRARRDSSHVASASGWLAAAVLALVVIQLVLGALLSTTRMASECPSVLLCPPSASELADSLHIFHRIIAITLAIATGALAAQLIRRGKRAARSALTLAALVVFQAGVGALMVMLHFPLWLALIHNAAALLVLLSTVWVLAGS